MPKLLELWRRVVDDISEEVDDIRGRFICMLIGSKPVTLWRRLNDEISVDAEEIPCGEVAGSAFCANRRAVGGNLTAGASLGSPVIAAKGGS